MRVRFPALSLLIVGLACGCASSPPAGDRAAVQVYEMNPYVGKPYEVLGPLWAGSWRTAFQLPTYPQERRGRCRFAVRGGTPERGRPDQCQLPRLRPLDMAPEQRAGVHLLWSSHPASAKPRVIDDAMREASLLSLTA